MPANRPQTLTIKPWMPDMPSYGSGASMTVQNVLPRTPLSYGPVGSLAAYSSSPLPVRCQGAVGAEDPSGVVSVFAGTASNLYQMAAGANTFTSVSKSANAYNVATSDFWSFAMVNARLVASNIADPMQSFVLGTDSAFSDLSVGAPKAKFIAGVKQWLFAANTNDGSAEPWRVWWSAIGDPTSWPTPGSAAAAAAQSDYNDMVTDGGEITGLVGNLGTADVAIFFERAVWRGVYVGAPDIFDFFQAEGVRGTQASSSIVQIGNLVYYLGIDGFYVFDGTQSQPIGFNKVDKSFFADLAQASMFRVVGAADPINKMIFWAYPSINSSGGSPDKIIVYNWGTGMWSQVLQPSEFLFRSISPGYTLDSLDSTGFKIDTLPASLDSRIWQGGQPTLGAFDTSHNLAFFTGSNLAPVVDTEELQFFPGQRAFIRNAKPLVDGDVPSIAIGTRNRTEDAVSFNVATQMNSLGWCPQRASGRYTRARITLSAGASFSHIQGVTLDCDPGGVR